jgi:hypothetical protein
MLMVGAILVRVPIDDPFIELPLDCRLLVAAWAAQDFGFPSSIVNAIYMAVAPAYRPPIVPPTMDLTGPEGREDHYQE